MSFKKLILLGLLVGLSTVSKAEPAEKRYYIDGVYLFNVVAKASSTDFNFSEDKGFAGFAGYRLNANFSLELGGIWFDPVKSLETDATSNINTEFEVTGYTFGARGEWPVGGLFKVWAGIGLFSWDSQFNYEIDYPSFPAVSTSGGDSNSGEDLYLRLGISQPISENLNFTIEATRVTLADFFSGAGANNSSLRQDYLGAGIEYSF